MPTTWNTKPKQIMRPQNPCVEVSVLLLLGQRGLEDSDPFRSQNSTQILRGIRKADKVRQTNVLAGGKRDRKTKQDLKKHSHTLTKSLKAQKQIHSWALTRGAA